MLAFQFKLTPAQVRTLLSLHCGRYHKIGGARVGGDDSYVPDCATDPFFITSGHSLISRGLVSHSNEQEPTWQITEQGRGVAQIIIDQCRQVVAMADTAKPMPVVKVRK